MKKIGLFFSCLLLIINYTTSFAAKAEKSVNTTITLYEQPNTKAQIIGSINPTQGLIPIFTSGNWTKVGDPTNGNVGWVTNEELNKKGFPKIFIKTFSKKTDNKNGSGYQIIQYSGSQVLDQKQAKTLIQNLQNQQMNLQKTFNQMLNQNLINFNEIAKQLQTQFNNSPTNTITIPVMQPIIIVPAQTPTDTNTKKTNNK